MPYKRPRKRHVWGIREIYRIAHSMRNLKYDIVHLQGDGIWESLLIRFLRNSCIINTVHDPIRHVDQRNYVNHKTMLDAIRKSSGWVVHSKKMKDLLVKNFYLSTEHILIHPHGIFDLYTRFSPQKNSVRGNNILFFGELRYNKGLDILLKAFCRIKHNLGTWHITIAGRGHDRSFTSSLMMISDQVIYYNRFISEQEVASLFCEAGIVVLPYRHGSQSGVLALAAAFGCPVLTTNFGSISELLTNNENAIIVETENVDAMANGLMTLCTNDSLREKIGSNLKILANKEWSWEVIADKTIDYYKSLLISN